ncbi:MAG: hypothetical protein H3C31_13180 [Brumimicrobium sp.]|nr:hypothetical protein [Brumimicrobium sp.]
MEKEKYFFNKEDLKTLRKNNQDLKKNIVISEDKLKSILGGYNDVYATYSDFYASYADAVFVNNK